MDIMYVEQLNKLKKDLTELFNNFSEEENYFEKQTKTEYVSQVLGVIKRTKSLIIAMLIEIERAKVCTNEKEAEEIYRIMTNTNQLIMQEVTNANILKIKAEFGLI